MKIDLRERLEIEELTRSFVDRAFLEIGFALVEAKKENEKTVTYKLNINIHPSVMEVLGKTASIPLPEGTPDQATEALAHLLSDLVQSGIMSRAKSVAIRALEINEKKEKKD